MILKLVAFVLLLVHHAEVALGRAVAMAHLCHRNIVSIPSDLGENSQHENQIYDGSLQIFGNRRIECSGTLTKWLLMPRSQMITGLHLAVFREKSPLLLEIVHETRVHNTKLPDETVGDWIFIPLPTPFDVEEGDFLGIYYDTFVVDSQNATIGSTLLETAPVGNYYPVTYVIPLSASQGLQVGVELNVSLAPQAYRIPALGVVIAKRHTTNVKMAVNSVETPGSGLLEALPLPITKRRRPRTTSAVILSTTLAPTATRRKTNKTATAKPSKLNHSTLRVSVQRLSGTVTTRRMRPEKTTMALGTTTTRPLKKIRATKTTRKPTTTTSSPSGKRRRTTTRKTHLESELKAKMLETDQVVAQKVVAEQEQQVTTTVSSLALIITTTRRRKRTRTTTLPRTTKSWWGAGFDMVPKIGDEFGLARKTFEPPPPMHVRGLIPASCLVEVPSQYSCRYKHRRVYFVYAQAVCREDYGCPSSENNFYSIEQCASYCGSLLF